MQDEGVDDQTIVTDEPQRRAIERVATVVAGDTLANIRRHLHIDFPR